MKKLLLFCCLITSVTAFGQIPPEPFNWDTIYIPHEWHEYQYPYDVTPYNPEEFNNIIDTGEVYFMITEEATMEYIIDPKYYVHIEDTGLVMITEKHGEEILQDYVDRHLAESAIRLWEEYETYCYNDSTLIHGATLVTLDTIQIDSAFRKASRILQESLTINDTMRWAYKPYTPTWYRHKQPTFYGFIEYLKTKRK